MRWTSRSHHSALAAYVLLSLLILGGVTWGTLSTLQLENERIRNIREREFFELVNQAAWRMDNYLQPIVTREVARSYRDYIAYARPKNVYLRDGSEIAEEAYVQASPLINERLEDWIQIHFFVGRDDHWQSPRLPDATGLSRFASAPTPTEYDIAHYTAVLEAIKSRVTFDALDSKFMAAAELAEQHERWAIGGHSDDPSKACKSIFCNKRFADDYRTRAENQRLVQTMTLPAEECETSETVVANLGQGLTLDESLDVRDVRVEVSETMLAVWLDGATLLNAETDGAEVDASEDDARGLAFIREVRLADLGLLGYQGFLVDWPSLREELVALSSDLLKGVTLTPIVGDSLDDVEAVLRSMSAGLSTEGGLDGYVAATVVDGGGWSSTRLMCVVAWVGTLLVLVAVGAGIHGLLSLTERRTQFTYAVTHELRTPLTTLRLYTDMLSSGLVPEGERERYLETLNKEAERLTDVVSGVLEYARVENKRSRLDEEELTVSELLQRIVDQCSSRCVGAGKELVTDVNGMGPASLRTDARLVCQLVTTLVDNACKYSSGAEDPSIVLRAHSERSGRLCLEVEDHGPGIESARRRDVFKPFQRGVETDHQKPGGIGLGLSLARDWARMLGGSLDLAPESVTQTGAVFRLTLPMRR